MNAQRLDSALAYEIAQAMMDGFNRHYDLFRSESAQAKGRFESKTGMVSNALSASE